MLIHKWNWIFILIRSILMIKSHFKPPNSQVSFRLWYHNLKYKKSNFVIDILIKVLVRRFYRSESFCIKTKWHLPNCFNDPNPTGFRQNFRRKFRGYASTMGGACCVHSGRLLHALLSYLVGSNHLYTNLSMYPIVSWGGLLSRELWRHTQKQDKWICHALPVLWKYRHSGQRFASGWRSCFDQKEAELCGMWWPFYHLWKGATPWSGSH